MTGFLMWGGAPWVIVFLVLAGAAALWWAGGLLQRGAWALRAPAVLVAFLGLAMLVGAGITAQRQGAMRAKHPAPGQLVDVGGYRAHVLCEGPQGVGPTLLWLSGGYGQGYWLKPLHDELKRERRSCLIDRPGAGWADPGPLPRGVERIVDEVKRAMDAAGEAGPFHVIGHSFGGLYAANFADAFPEATASIIQLDPTPPAWFVEGAALYGCGSPGGNPVTVLGAQFGLAYIPALNPLLGPPTQVQRNALGPDWPVLVANEIRPAALISQSNALHAACSDPFSIVRTPGALGDTPLFTIVQTRDPDWLKWAPKHLSERGLRNWKRWSDHQRTEYRALSSRSHWEEAPLGATHDFPLKLPDYTLERVRSFIAQAEGGKA